MSPTPGTGYSLKEFVEGSNLPILLTLDSVNHTMPCLSTVIASGAAFDVGTAYSSIYLGRSPDVFSVVAEIRGGAAKVASRTMQHRRDVFQSACRLVVFRGNCDQRPGQKSRLDKQSSL